MRRASDRLTRPEMTWPGEAATAQSSVRCPSCGHILFTVDLEGALSRPTRFAADAPLLLRVTEAAQLLGISRSVLDLPRGDRTPD